MVWTFYLYLLVVHIPQIQKIVLLVRMIKVFTTVIPFFFYIKVSFEFQTIYILPIVLCRHFFFKEIQYVFLARYIHTQISAKLQLYVTFVILALRVLKFETSKVVVMFFKRGLKRFHNFENHTKKKIEIYYFLHYFLRLLQK